MQILAYRLSRHGIPSVYAYATKEDFSAKWTEGYDILFDYRYDPFVFAQELLQNDMQDSFVIERMERESNEAFAERACERSAQRLKVGQVLDIL